MGLELFEQLLFGGLGLLLFESLKARLDEDEIGEVHLDLEVVRFDERLGSLAGGVGETANDVAQGIHLAHGAQHPLIESLAFSGRRRRGHVAEGDLRVDGLLGLVQGRHRVHAGVGDLDHAEVGLAARGAVAGFGREARQRIEYRSFSAARKTNQTDLHGSVLARAPGRGQ